MTSVALHVGQLLQPLPGGIGTYVRALIEELPRAGIDLSAFAAGPAPEALDVPYSDLGLPRGALRYEAWLRFRAPRLSLRCAVVHGPSLAVPPSRTRGSDAALVVTIHDVAFLRYPQHFTKRGVSFHRRGLEVARRDADIIITPSEFTRQELGIEGFDLERVIAAPHGIRAGIAPPDDTLMETLTRLDITPPFVLGVGTIEPRKGFSVVAAALEKLGSEACPFVIAGPEGWNEVSGFDQADVRRLGHVDGTTLDALYRTATACVVPSEYEGFGLPALEAMARGCPVIASDTSSLPEVLGSAGLLVPFGDIPAWSGAIERVIHDRDFREQLARLGQTRASGFTWAASARTHAIAYSHALARRTHSS